jgi:hypothetical protein
LARQLLLFGDIGIQLENVFLETLVLLDQGEIPDRNAHEPRDKKQEHHEARQLSQDP